MESLRLNKFENISKEDMDKIKGGTWNVYKGTGVTRFSDGNTQERMQRYNFFGLHGTNDDDYWLCVD
jgi:hypothetical protein